MSHRMLVCGILDLQVFKISPCENTSLLRGNSGDKPATFPPPGRPFMFVHFLQSRWNGYTTV